MRLKQCSPTTAGFFYFPLPSVQSFSKSFSDGKLLWQKTSNLNFMKTYYEKTVQTNGTPKNTRARK